MRFVVWILLVVSACGYRSETQTSGHAPNGQTTSGGGASSVCDSDSSPFAGGNGTVGSPYLITEPCHLLSIGDTDYSGANYRIVNDLDLTSFDEVFFVSVSGTLDGNNKTLSNWTGAGALFTESNGTIQNIRIQNFVVSGSDRVGLLVGHNHTSGLIKNAVVQGTLTAKNYFSGGVSGVNDGTIENSSAAVQIVGEGYTGGLVGHNTGTIRRSSATGTVTNTIDPLKTKYSGGFAGRNNGIIQDCYASGNISGYSQVGGLVGYNTGNVVNSYSIGIPSGSSSDIGGLIGLNSGGSISSSYWDTQTSTVATSSGGTAKTTAEMQTTSTFTGWDFSSIWNSPSSGVYPTLK